MPPKKKIVIGKEKVKLIEIEKKDDINADDIEQDDIEQDDIEQDDIEQDDIEQDDINTDDIEQDDINADDIEQDDNKKDNTNNSIISKNNKINIPELIIKEKKDDKNNSNDNIMNSKEESEKEIKISKPIKNENKIIQNQLKPVDKDKIISKEKTEHHTKSKKLVASKNLESSFDMFGDDDVDHRFVMKNYDYTKNKTLPKITKFEKALLIGKRAKQIEDGANPNIKVMPGQDAIKIAEEELRQRKIPFIIKRPIGNTFEYWKPADMEVNMD